MKLAVLLVLCSGCAKLLGLDDTKFDFRDATVDAPSVCDGAPMCTGGTGRSVCGQLFDTGANAGQLVRAASPTGAVCAAGGAGPCALAIYGQSTASFFGGVTTDRIAGTIDDCGRFVVPSLPETDPDVAIVVTGTGTSAELVLGRPTSVGEDVGVAVYVVDAATITDWGNQISTSNPPTITDGYVVTHLNAANMLASGVQIRVNGGAVKAPPLEPWGAYFSGMEGFGAIDPNLSATGPAGTALVVQSGSFSLGGLGTGANCKVLMVQSVANALVHVTLHAC